MFRMKKLNALLVILGLSLSLSFGVKGFSEEIASLKQQMLPTESQDVTIDLTQKTAPPESIDISVSNIPNKNEALLLINQDTILTFKGTVGNIPAQVRAKIVHDRLQTYLKNDGHPKNIKPGYENGHLVIRADKMVLVTLDPHSAQAAKMSQKDLALNWTNRIRKALGVEELTHSIALMPSRGLNYGRLKPTGQQLRGYASWYGHPFHGRITANGERYNMYGMTAAHKTLPFNTMVRVTNTRNGKSTVVRITDRGPYIHGRIIDLSHTAAKEIGMLSSGTAPVVVDILER